MKVHNRGTRRLERSLLSCALASCLAMASPTILAQSAGATLHGQVSGASAGTEVTATNVATGSVRRTRTSSAGSYTLVGLEPGVYTVEAGPGTAQTIRLSVAANSTLDLGAGAAEAPGGAATTLGTITVTAPALEDINTSEVGSTISQHQIQTIPQVSRNFLEFADTVPGMTFSRDNTGRTSLRGGAQTTSSSNVYIDGVGQKSYVKEGGITGQFDSAGNPFPQLAIGEYKVITSNYKAEYGQISSAAVTAVTRSGTNEFHGEAYYRYTDQDMRARTVAEDRAGGDKTRTFEKEYGFALGGPIIQDRLHFFLTYENKNFDIPTVVTPGNGTDALVPLLPPDVQAVFGPTSQPFDEDLFFGKVDWDITDRDRVAVSGQVRDENTIGNVGAANAYSHGINTDNYDRRWSARWEHSADFWFNELLYTHEDAFNNPQPITFGNGFIYTGQGNDPTIIQVGGGSPLAAQTKGQKGWSIEDNLTFNNFEWNGGHTFKMGVRYKDIDLYAADALDINPQFSFSVGTTFDPNQPWKAFFTKPVTGLGGLAPSVVTNDKQYGVYFQDDWQVNEKLLLNLGLRWDYESNGAYEDFVTPANVVAALQGQDPRAPAGQTYAQTLANGGININDYISTGSNRDGFDGQWQPRLGFSYDFNADQQHVLHGGAGRAYDRNLYDYLQLEITKSALPQVNVFFRDPVTGVCKGDPCFDWDPNFLNGLGNLQALVGPTGNAGVEVDLINNNLEVPYSDQFSLGISNQLGDWLTDITAVRIHSYDGFVFTLGNRYPNGDFFQNGGQPWGNGVPGFGALILGSNGIETKSTQLLVSANKPYTRESGWSASLAYTWTDAEGNRAISEHYAFDGATIHDYPFLDSNAVSKHRFVAAGSWDGWWGITFGAKLTLATPIPVNDFVCQPPTEPDMGFCVPHDATPGGNGKFLVGGKVFGYRSLDLQATKDFHINDDWTFFARLDVINALNFNNYTETNIFSQNGQLFATYRLNGNATMPRTVYVQAGFRF